MKKTRIGNTALLLATCVASGCASVDRSGASFHDAKEVAAVETVRICSDVAPVGSHMKKVVCRTREVIDATGDRARRALRAHSQRVQLEHESGGR